MQAARGSAAAALAERRKLTPKAVAAHYGGVAAGVVVQGPLRQPCPSCGSLARQKELGLLG